MLYMFIYETTNTINGKKYIGQHTTTNIDDGYLGSGVALTRAINKYGKDNFSRKILQYANNKDELNELEKYFIDKFNAIESDMYYNIAEGGEGGNTWAGLTEEHKAKLREALKDRELTEEWKAKISESAKITMNRPEVKKKISEALKGIQRSEQTKQKISENNGRYWQGKQRSEQTKGKMSEAMKGKYQGKDNPTSKPVLMIDKNNNILACFYSVGEANEYLGKPKYNDNVSTCARGKQKSAWGYNWKYIQLITL